MSAYLGSTSSTCISVEMLHNAGCRLVLLTNSDMTVTQLQAMVPVTLGSLKQQLLKVRAQRRLVTNCVCSMS